MQTKAEEYRKKWDEHLNDFDRLLLAFDGDYQDFIKYKDEYHRAKLGMHLMILKASSFIKEKQ